MKKWTERGTYLAGLLAVLGGPFVAQQGCGGDETNGGDGGTTTLPPTGCTGAEISCGGTCIDPFTSSAHCGTCNNACTADQTCTAGECTCSAGRTACASGCVITNTDPANCGSCDHPCTEFEECINGSCQCPGGLATCSSGCADILTDKLNCGQCNIPCVAAQSCVDGNCECPEGGELCGLECVDTNSDSNFCGACDNPCDSGDYCNAGTCESISGCDQVNMDQYEGNDTCALARDLPEATEGAATPVTVANATLHHQDETLDTDWYAVYAKEGSHSGCGFLSGQCYFIFNIAFTPPDAAAYATYQVCVVEDDCGGTQTCSTAGDWNAQAGRYEMEVPWEGTCGLTDDRQFYVKIARNGGTESCAQYRLEYEFTYTDEGC